MYKRENKQKIHSQPLSNIQSVLPDKQNVAHVKRHASDPLSTESEAKPQLDSLCNTLQCLPPKAILSPPETGAPAPPIYCLDHLLTLTPLTNYHLHYHPSCQLLFICRLSQSDDSEFLCVAVLLDLLLAHEGHHFLVLGARCRCCSIAFTCVFCDYQGLCLAAQAAKAHLDTHIINVTFCNASLCSI